LATFRTAIVTGASRGLGRQIAEALAREGWAVGVNHATDPENAAAVVEAIRTAGGHAHEACFDVTDEAAVTEGTADLRATLGPIELIVNNATGPQPTYPIEKQTWEHHLDQLNFFVKAPLLMLQANLLDWKQRNVGRVINIGSEVFNIGNPEAGHYVAAKGAMLGLTRSWAKELGPYGITVNLVEPGWIPVERHVGTPAAEIENYKRLVPLGRMGVPADLVGIVAFLASPAANFITGQAFAVNGGRTL
jgi:3-oxoacyl-[acyl-carrier protein] reductase